jgi:hypothetical protein
LTLDGATGVNIAGNSSEIDITTTGTIDINSQALDIDASGAITIDGTSTILISGDAGATFGDDTESIAFDGSGNVDFDAVALDIDASAGITMTSTTMAFDPTTSFDLDSAGPVTIDGTSITIGNDDSGVPIRIGHTTSETTVGDNLTVIGNLAVTGSTLSSGSLQVGYNSDGHTGRISASGEVSSNTLKVSGHAVTIQGPLDVEGESKINQDLTSDATPTAPMVTLPNVAPAKVGVASDVKS